MSWELIHIHLLHPSDSAMKSMCRHQTLYGLPKSCPTKIHKTPCTICYTSKMTTTNKGTKIDTSNLQPGDLVHVEFVFYNVTSSCGFNPIITVVCARTRIIWLFPTASKKAPVRIIRFILTTLMNEQHQCKLARVFEDSALENSTCVINLLVDEFKIYMKNTGGDASWLNGKNERHNRIIHNMVRAALIDSNYHETKWWCAA